MDEVEVLKNKRILAVDDEPDILETLEEILDMCELDVAETYEKARDLMEKNVYDAAILDIMGVNGYELLQESNRIGLPAVMLTSHALTMENLVKFMRAGAQSFIPKDKIVDIPFFLFAALDTEDQASAAAAEVEAGEGSSGKAEAEEDESDVREVAATAEDEPNPSGPKSRRWLDRLKSFYDRKFGSNWMDDYDTGVG